MTRAMQMEKRITKKRNLRRENVRGQPSFTYANQVRRVEKCSSSNAVEVGNNTPSDSCCNTIQYKVNIIGVNNSLLHSQLSMDFTVDFFLCLSFHKIFSIFIK